jgi:hypothetical protein
MRASVHIPDIAADPLYADFHVQEMDGRLPGVPIDAPGVADRVPEATRDAAGMSGTVHDAVRRAIRARVHIPDNAASVFHADFDVQQMDCRLPGAPTDAPGVADRVPEATGKG